MVIFMVFIVTFLFVDGGPGVLRGHPHCVHCHMFLFVDGGPGVLCGHPHGVHYHVFLFVDGGLGVLRGHPHGVHHRVRRRVSGHSVPELQLRLETRQGRPQEALLPDVRGTLPRGN